MDHVLAPPPTPLWAVSEVLLWRSLAAALVSEEKAVRDYALTALAAVGTEVQAASDSLGVLLAEQGESISTNDVGMHTMGIARTLAESVSRDRLDAVQKVAERCAEAWLQDIERRSADAEQEIDELISRMRT